MASTTPSSSLTPLPTGYDKKQVAAWLTGWGVNNTAFGKGQARSVEDLAREMEMQECEMEAQKEESRRAECARLEQG